MSSKNYALVKRFDIVEAGSDDPVSLNDLPRVETYTIHQIASLLDICETLAYDMVRKGEIPAKRLGRRWVVSRARFTAWLNDQPAGA
jgi:excisionase family DNA binding protein